MTPITISQTGTGRSSVSVPDSFRPTFNIGMQLIITGAATFNVEITMDDTSSSTFSASTANWSVPSGFSALTASTVLSLTIPCHGISINVTSGEGTVTLRMVQTGVR